MLRGVHTWRSHSQLPMHAKSALAAPHESVESRCFLTDSKELCRNGILYTLNAQSPETAWQDNKEDLRKAASSFQITE